MSENDLWIETRDDEDILFVRLNQGWVDAIQRDHLFAILMSKIESLQTERQAKQQQVNALLESVFEE